MSAEVMVLNLMAIGGAVVSTAVVVAVFETISAVSARIQLIAKAPQKSSHGKECVHDNC
jgi:hypothetical protein